MTEVQRIIQTALPIELAKLELLGLILPDALHAKAEQWRKQQRDFQPPCMGAAEQWVSINQRMMAERDKVLAIKRAG